MRITCENCGLGLETDHEGDWDHTCPDGRHGKVVPDGHVDNAFTTTRITAALSSFTTTAAEATNALNAMWTIYNQTYKT